MNYYTFTITNPEGLEVQILRREDGAQISQSESNGDYQVYLAWVAEGNTAEEWTGN